MDDWSEEEFSEPEHEPGQTHDDGWQPDLNPTQKKIFDDPAPAVLGYGEKACRPLDTQIYTDTGLVRLGNLKPKDSVPGTFAPISQSVQAFDGEKIVTAKADAYWSESGNEAVRAVLAHGGELVGSPRHPVWVCWRAPDGKHGFQYYKLSEMLALKEQGWRFWTPFVGHPNWTTQKLKSIQLDLLDNVSITKGFAYALGALTGDGCLSRLDDSCGFTNMDDECIGAVRDGLREASMDLSATSVKIQYYVRPISRARTILRAIRLEGLSYHKRIPDIVIASPKEIAAQFLSGLFDADGTVSKNGNIQYCTTSEKLGLDVQDVLAAFGILCIRRSRKSASGRPTWTLSIHGRHAAKFATDIGFRIHRKQDRILTARPSFKCPTGFNRNRYGFPDPIRFVLKSIALANRSDRRPPRTPFRFRERKGPRVTSWYLNAHVPWQEKPIWRSANTRADANVIEVELESKRTSFLEQNYRSREWHDKHRRLHSFGSVPALAKVNDFFSLYGEQKEVVPFLLSETWLEIESLKPCESELADLRVPGPHSFLASGTINKNSGKTCGFLHKIVRHCYENWNALFVVISITIRTGKEGALHELESLILPAWRDGNRDKNRQLMDRGIGLDYESAKIDPSTKDRHLWIGNRHGGWSKILFVSAPYQEVVEDRIKAYSPSGVYVEEITNCRGRTYYTFPQLQLGRRADIEGPQQFCASCNPAGPSHWVHDVWFKEAVDAEGNRDPFFSVHHVPIHENVHRLPDGYVERLEKTLKNDVDRRRLINGEWVDRPSGDAIFGPYYVPEIHVKPYPPTNPRRGLVPQPGQEIHLGWDPGPVNFSVSFLQMIPTKEKIIWICFDEVNFVGHRTPYFVVVPKVLKRMDYWINHPKAGSNYKFRHIGDEAAFNQPRSDGSFDSVEIFKLSNNRIKMVACPKGKESVPARCRMLVDLLLEERFFISDTCTKTKEMMLNLESEQAKPGDYDPNVGFRPVRSQYIHPFDSTTYPIFYYAVRPARHAMRTEEVKPMVYTAGQGRLEIPNHQNTQTPNGNSVSTLVLP